MYCQHQRLLKSLLAHSWRELVRISGCALIFYLVYAIGAMEKLRKEQI